MSTNKLNHPVDLGRGKSGEGGGGHPVSRVRKGGCAWISLQASSPIWASEASLARTHERAREAEERRACNDLGPSLARSREARPNRRACSQAMPESHQAFEVAEVQISGLVFSQQTGFTSASIHILINQWSQLRRCTKRPAIGPGFKTVPSQHATHA